MLVLAVLIVDVPHAMPEPEKPKAIQVELLPPKKKAKAKPAQKPKPAAKKQSKPKKSTSKQSAKAKPRQVLRPVFKFGEKDSGSGKPVKGDAKREENIARTTPVKKPNKEPIESKLTPTVPLTTQSDTTKAAASKKAATAKVVAKAAAAASASKPKPKLPAKTVKIARSQPKDKGPVATTAIGELTRGIRAGKLCVTELRRQLNSANPPHWPNLLPSYRLDSGNILQVRKGAFRTNRQWINLKFRCEIDDAATEIVSFGFEVGSVVPRSEWSSRGLPES